MKPSWLQTGCQLLPCHLWLSDFSFLTSAAPRKARSVKETLYKISILKVMKALFSIIVIIVMKELRLHLLVIVSSADGRQLQFFAIYQNSMDFSYNFSSIIFLFHDFMISCNGTEIGSMWCILSEDMSFC